jgi:hypothetical protein
MAEDVPKSGENFLNPEVLRPNLIMASLYIAAFEMLKDTIIDRTRDFYTTGFDSRVKKNGGRRTSPDYEEKYCRGIAVPFTLPSIG